MQWHDMSLKYGLKSVKLVKIALTPMAVLRLAGRELEI